MSRRCHDHRCSRVSARASDGDRVGHDRARRRPDRGRIRGADDRGRVPGFAQVQLVFWDGSTIGSADGPGQLILNSPDALRRIMWAPGELGFARADIAGDLDVVGPIGEVLRAFQASLPAECDEDPTPSELTTGLMAGRRPSPRFAPSAPSASRCHRRPRRSAPTDGDTRCAATPWRSATTTTSATSSTARARPGDDVLVRPVRRRRHRRSRTPRPPSTS